MNPTQCISVLSIFEYFTNITNLFFKWSTLFGRFTHVGVIVLHCKKMPLLIFFYGFGASCMFLARAMKKNAVGLQSSGRELAVLPPRILRHCSGYFYWCLCLCIKLKKLPQTYMLLAIGRVCSSVVFAIMSIARNGWLLALWLMIACLRGLLAFLACGESGQCIMKGLLPFLFMERSLGFIVPNQSMR